MIDNRLKDLGQCGQSVWLDSLSRNLLRSGKLAGLINDDGVTGVTANPSIFEKAIAGSHDYDETIHRLAGSSGAPMRIYETLALEDVGEAADLLHPTYRAMGGADGFVSIEVSPALAHDTQGTIDEARRFWQALNRENVMIKVPATPEGIPAIEQLTAEGININITLIFAVEVYEEVMQAYIRGLRRRLGDGSRIDHIASVASFFVSRVDTLVDEMLDEKAQSATGTSRVKLEGLRGKAAVANAKIAYEHFERTIDIESFKDLTLRGAQIQRPLWASTGAKNPAYSDTLYVDSLVGPHTVNTMPLDTIEAFKDHGSVQCRAINQGIDEAHGIMRDLASAGIDMKQVTDRLTVEGIDKFNKALHGLLEAIEQRTGALTTA